MDKDYAISYLRVIAMLLVVLGHALGIYSSNVYWPFDKNIVWYWTDINRVIYAIHMPIFFVLSGYLYSHLFTFHDRYKDSKLFLVEKFKRLIIPYITWVIIQAIIFRQYLATDTIYNGGFHLWFLLALFWMFVIALLCKPIWTKLSVRHQFPILLVLIVVSSASSIYSYLPKALCLKQLFTFLPYFYFGIIMGKIPMEMYKALIKRMGGVNC